MPDSQRYPWNIYLINNIVYFPFWKVIQMFSRSRNAQVTFVVNPQLKIISFLNYKHWYLTYTWSEKAFKGTVVNREIEDRLKLFNLPIWWKYIYSPWMIYFMILERKKQSHSFKKQRMFKRKRLNTFRVQCTVVPEFSPIVGNPVHLYKNWSNDMFLRFGHEPGR